MRKSKFRYVATVEIDAEATLKDGQAPMPSQMRKQVFDDITMRLKSLVEMDIRNVNGVATVRVSQTYGDAWEVDDPEPYEGDNNG